MLMGRRRISSPLLQNLLHHPFHFLFQLHQVGGDVGQRAQGLVLVEILGKVDFVADFVLAAVHPRIWQVGGDFSLEVGVDFFSQRDKLGIAFLGIGCPCGPGLPCLLR